MSPATRRTTLPSRNEADSACGQRVCRRRWTFVALCGSHSARPAPPRKFAFGGRTRCAQGNSGFLKRQKPASVFARKQRPGGLTDDSLSCLMRIWANLHPECLPSDSSGRALFAVILLPTVSGIFRASSRRFAVARPSMSANAGFVAKNRSLVPIGLLFRYALDAPTVDFAKDSGSSRIVPAFPQVKGLR